MKERFQSAKLRVVAPEELEAEIALPKMLFRVLDEALTALEKAGIPHVVIGGLAARAYGLRATTDDIDFLVEPPMAIPASVALAAAGFRTWVESPTWLHKAVKYGIEVDVIYESAGRYHADEETFRRAVHMDMNGRRAAVLSLEDLFVIKALVANLATPRHEQDAVKVLRGYALDWEYVTRRARGRSRKVVKTLLAGHEAGVAIPMWVFTTLSKPILADPR